MRKILPGIENCMAAAVCFPALSGWNIAHIIYKRDNIYKRDEKRFTNAALNSGLSDRG